MPSIPSCLLAFGLLLGALSMGGGSDARAQTPGWSVDPAVFELSMGIIGEVHLDGVAHTDPRDSLAVFAGTELRGVAGATVVGGQTLFFLTVYGNTDTEGNTVTDTLTFELYQAETATVRLLDTTLSFAADIVVGSVRQPFGWQAGTAPGTPPSWSVDPLAFGTSMNLVGRLFFDGQPALSENTRVAAFVGDEVRGVAAPTFVDGQAVYFLTVYDEGDPEGDTITLKAYDPITDTERDLAQTYLYETNGLLGGLASPLTWTAGGGGGVNEPTWSVDPSAYAFTMTVVAQVFLDGVALESPNDRLAVFDGTEALRGVAGTTVVGGQALFFLTVYSDTDTEVETLTLQVYDALADTVRPLDQTLLFTAWGTEGSLALPLVWTASTTPQVNRPRWSVEATGFQSSMQIVGAVFVAGERLSHPGDLVAAFVGDEVRGVAAPTFVDGQAVYFLTVYANVEGETLTFKTYHAAVDTVEDLAEGVLFTSDDLHGSLASPHVWNRGEASVLLVSVRLLLEGPYDGNTDMETNLAAAGRLPLSQPYADPRYDGTPLDYDGTESVVVLPDGAVDWVLIELRADAVGATLARRAALLKSDGTLVDVDTVNPVSFSGMVSGDYFVVIRHRNHLAAMSAEPLPLGSEATLYDFTTAAAQAYGEYPMKDLGTGLFGLYAGDGDADGGTTAGDQSVWLLENGFNGYLDGDYDLDGGNTAGDQAVWLLNNGFNSLVPKN